MENNFEKSKAEFFLNVKKRKKKTTHRSRYDPIKYKIYLGEDGQYHAKVRRKAKYYKNRGMAVNRKRCASRNDCKEFIKIIDLMKQNENKTNISRT